MTQRQIRRLFPGIGRFAVESPESVDYNCIAWAGGDSANRWWPDSAGKDYWPPGVSRAATVEAFTEAYGVLGYEPCENGDLEDGTEKVAIYTDSNGTPTHAARQRQSGRWTSKLGNAEDIEHSTAAALNGGHYGNVAAYMRRRISDAEEETAEDAAR